MPKKPKSGPPYTDIPDEVYVVVTNPWGMNSNPRLRDSGDFNRVASWAQFALQQAGLGGGRIPTIECVYGMGTRNEIILQFPEGTDIIPLLGRHRWSNFEKHCPDPNNTRSTCVFIYNWRDNGDPANHNWTENFPRSLPLDSVPAKSPYPAPCWTAPPSTLTNLVHSIPRPATPPPMLDSGHNPGQDKQSVTSPPPPKVTPSPAPPEQRDLPESGEEPTAQDSVSTGLFRPYKPPAQHPSHATFLNQKQVLCEEASLSRASPPSPEFIKKLDPYELDEDALNALRSPSPDQETKGTENEDIKLIPLSIKAEIVNVKMENDNAQHNFASASDSRYQPSQALIDAFNSLRQPEQTSPSARPLTRDLRGRPNAASEIIPPASSGYQPSAELEAEINALLQGRTAVASSSSSDSDALSSPITRVSIKREYEDDLAASLGIQVGEGKKIKIEEY